MNTNEQEASQSKEPELIKKVPGGWWTIGIGLATVLIGGLTLNQMYKNNAGNTSIGSGIPDTTSGGAYDMFVDRTRVFHDEHPHGAIVIHKTASNARGVTAQDIARYFATSADIVSSHFVIGRDGVVVQCVSLLDGAGANCCLNGNFEHYWLQYGGTNLNTVTVSIEHVDETSDNSQDCTDVQ